MIEELKSRRNSKDTVFIDLFSIPKYQLQLFHALHPEINDVTEDDIKLITLNPVILNLDYNDLGILVKDKLIIFVEAQSTWTINILIRMLLYLAMTYQDYITERNLYVYGSKKIKIPEPEFYIVYTGNKKFDKDIISLREDFWNNSNAMMDLKAKIISMENKNDIIGQYIIFCHVFDEQIKIYGRKKSAVENTIRICQNEGVLREYLEDRKKEVISIMITLFDQKYNVEAYAREQKEEGIEQGKIQGIIETCRYFGASLNDVINMVAKKFNFSKEKAEEYVNEFWNVKSN